MGVLDRRLVTIVAIVTALFLTLMVAVLAITVRNLDRRLTQQLASVEERLQTETMERTAAQNDLAEHLRILEQALTTKPVVQHPPPLAPRRPLVDRLTRRFKKDGAK